MTPDATPTMQEIREALKDAIDEAGRYLRQYRRILGDHVLNPASAVSVQGAANVAESKQKTLRWLASLDVAELLADRDRPKGITEDDINLLLAEAAIYRSSYLGGGGEVLTDDDDTTREYAKADRLDDLAETLAPFCVPPLAELAQQCADCTDGVKYGHACNSCRGTGLWPPTRDGIRVRLLDAARIPSERPEGENQNG